MRQADGRTRQRQLPIELDTLYRELGTLQKEDERCRDLLQFRSIVTAHQYTRLVRLTEGLLQESLEVLDWGCGNGHFSYLLERLGHEVHGYAFEEFGLRRHLSERYRFTLGTEGEPALLPYDDDSFDAVFSVGVLEHVRETGGTEGASMAEIGRVLRPGGYFVCYHLPNRYSWIEAVNRIVPGQHRHRNRYTRTDIERLCGDAGLECTLVDRYGALPRNLWSAAPEALRASTSAVAAWNAVDEGLRRMISPFCQNYLFVARKPER